MLHRVPTGVSGLDPLIEGGLPKGILCLLAGAPGTGKTSMSCQYLEKGATLYNEKGLYVSLLESKETLLTHLSHHFGPHFSDLVKSGMINILTFPSMKSEGVPAMMDSIMTTIKDGGVKRLVIDSVTALSQSFADERESRIFTHTVLTKLIPSYGCTTFVTKEIPSDGSRIGESAEDFVADGVFILRRLVHRGRTLRELEIAKLRGTRIESPVHPLTLEGGFTVFPPFSHEALGRLGKLKRIPDSDTHFSTGNTSLDTILGGGYPRGTMALLEVGEAIPLSVFGVISYPIVANFLNHGSPLVGIQSLGADPARTYERWKAVAGENAAYGRSVERSKGDMKQEKPYLATLKNEKPEDSVREYLRVGDKLRKQTGKPMMWWVALDHFVDIFGLEYADKALSELSTNVIRQRELAVVLAKPGLERIVGTVSNVAATHLRLLDKDGSVLMYGVKPRTSLHAVTVDAEKGLSSTSLIPIV